MYTQSQHIEEELEYEYFDQQEKLWRETLLLPTEAELIAKDPSLLKYVRNALKTIKARTPTEEDVTAWLKNLYASNLSESDKMFTEVCFEKIIFPEIQDGERRIWQLKKLLPHKKNARLDDFPELLNRARQVPIVGEIEKYLRVTKYGSKYKALCPFHDEKTASFYIYPDSNSFYCFGCHAGGDVIKFIQLISGLSFREAVRELNQT